MSLPVRDAASGRIAAYYDHLSIWTRLARPFGYGGGSDQLTVHRGLADPRAGGRATMTRVHDLIVESIPSFDRPRLLDAGCGLGGTILDLTSRLDGSGVGLTLSQTQRDLASRAAADRGMHDRLEFRVQGYDQPPSGPFDLIVAIESLAHSPNPLASVSALVGALAPGGAFVVVDDMPLASAIGSRDLDLFRQGWQVPVLLGRADYLGAFSRLGLSVRTVRDLSPDLRLRTLAQISRMERVNRIASVIPSARWRGMLASYHGGLALERLYRQASMEYLLVVAVRNPANSEH